MSLHLAHAGNQSQRGIGSFLPARGAFHAMNISSACVLTGSYDLLKDRRVHDDSARFKFESCVILSTNQNALIRKATNEFASFCVDNRLGQTAIFTILPKWERIRSTRFQVKQPNFCVICLYYARQIDSMLPRVCSVINQRHQNVVTTSETQPTTFWFHLQSITEQTHGYIESILHSLQFFFFRGIFCFSRTSKKMFVLESLCHFLVCFLLPSLFNLCLRHSKKTKGDKNLIGKDEITADFVRSENVQENCHVFRVNTHHSMKYKTT